MTAPASVRAERRCGKERITILVGDAHRPVDVWVDKKPKEPTFVEKVRALIVDARVLATAALAFDDLEGNEIGTITMTDIAAVLDCEEMKEQK